MIGVTRTDDFAGKGENHPFRGGGSRARHTGIRLSGIPLNADDHRWTVPGRPRVEYTRSAVHRVFDRLLDADPSLRWQVMHDPPTRHGTAAARSTAPRRPMRRRHGGRRGCRHDHHCQIAAAGAPRTGDVVVLRVLAASAAGWSGEATHLALPGKSCVTYAGVASTLPSVPQTAVDHVQPLGDRDLVCDKPQRI
jgi:hypothetical protein